MKRLDVDDGFHPTVEGILPPEDSPLSEVLPMEETGATVALPPVSPTVRIPIPGEETPRRRSGGWLVESVLGAVEGEEEVDPLDQTLRAIRGESFVPEETSQEDWLAALVSRERSRPREPTVPGAANPFGDLLQEGSGQVDPVTMLFGEDPEAVPASPDASGAHGRQRATAGAAARPLLDPILGVRLGETVLSSPIAGEGTPQEGPMRSFSLATGLMPGAASPTDGFGPMTVGVENRAVSSVVTETGPWTAFAGSAPGIDLPPSLSVGGEKRNSLADETVVGPEAFGAVSGRATNAAGRIAGGASPPGMPSAWGGGAPGEAMSSSRWAPAPGGWNASAPAGGGGFPAASAAPAWGPVVGSRTMAPAANAGGIRPARLSSPFGSSPSSAWSAPAPAPAGSPSALAGSSWAGRTTGLPGGMTPSPSRAMRTPALRPPTMGLSPPAASRAGKAPSAFRRPATGGLGTPKSPWAVMQSPFDENP